MEIFNPETSRPADSRVLLAAFAPSKIPGNYVIPQSSQSSLKSTSCIKMRIAQRLLMATPASIGSKSSLSEALALLPPLQLYRRILRVHRKLEPEMRVLGDSYVKNEFRAHRSVENPLHIIGFLTEWQLYAQKLEGDQWTGDKLDQAKLDKMSDQQLGQLLELMQALRNEGEGEGQ
ncbi:Complex 1 LYR protein [Penicillium viridicatum]|nr:Complex 1 LYR protein [Penicillium viridicatum]